MPLVCELFGEQCIPDIYDFSFKSFQINRTIIRTTAAWSCFSFLFFVYLTSNKIFVLLGFCYLIILFSFLSSLQDISANQLCDSISTDRSGSSQQVDLIGQEGEGELGVAGKASVLQTPVAAIAGPSAMPREGDAAPGTVATGGPLPTAVALGDPGVLPELAPCSELAGPTPEQSKDAGKLHANKELKEEMDLDFEEISDGELEAEESGRCRGLGDPLGVDWGSLAQEALRPLKPVAQREQQFPVSARNRWKAHHILLDIGISARLAGQNYAQRVLTESKEKLREELEEFRAATVAGRAGVVPCVTVSTPQEEKKQLVAKQETQEMVPEGDQQGQEQDQVAERKHEPKEQDVKGTDESAAIKLETGADERTASSSPVGVKKPSPAAAAEPAASVSSVERELEDVDRILHPIAAIHVALREQARLRRNLILATEPVPGQRHQCGRALSARKDLQIRRQLCGFPPATLATMAACAAGAAAGYLNQELHADAPLGGGGGTASPALHEQIVQMYRQMVAQQRQQASQGICTTLEAV